AVGVFLSFTLSQAGMVVHWWREGRAIQAARESSAKVASKSHWRKSLVVNGLGAIATCIVLIIFIATKFVHGAWVVVALIPLLVLMFLKIHRHYVDVARQLSTEGLAPLRPIDHEVVVPISGIHRGVIAALQYAKSIAPHHVTA